MNRRAFWAGIVGILSAFSVGAAAAQIKKSIMEGSKAVQCDGQTYRCGSCGHQSCTTINATMVVGNENRNYPDTSVLFDFRIVRCDNCKVLSTLE